MDAGFEWIFDSAERFLLIRVFEGLVKDYRANPRDLNERVRETWYSSRGRKDAGQNQEDFEEWIRQLQQFRGEYSSLAADWLKTWKMIKQEPFLWTLESEHVDPFLTLINDYRLARAAEMDIGQGEMDAQWDEIPDRARRMALAEIHILAAMMEGLIRLSDN
jgi:hypothetical protein